MSFFFMGQRTLFRSNTSFGRGALVSKKEIPVRKLLILSNGSFSRNSSGSYHNGSTSSLAWASPNILRIEDRGDGNGPAYLIEGLFNQYVQYPNTEFMVPFSSSWYRSNNATGSLVNGLSPDKLSSSVTRIQLEPSSTGNFIYYSMINKIPFHITGTYSVFVKPHSVSSDVGLRFLDLYTGSADFTEYVFYTAISGGWERLFLTGSTNSGSRGGQVRFRSRHVATDFFDHDSWGANFTDTKFPVSYVRDSGSFGSDILFFESSSIPAQIYDGRWYIDVFPYFNDVENTGSIKTILAFSSSLGRDEIRFQDRQIIVRQAFTNVVSLTGLSWNRHEKLRIWVDPSQGELSLSSSTNGIKTAYGNSWTWPNQDKMYIGSRSDPTSSPFYGRISDIYDASTDYLLDYNLATFSRDSEASWWDGFNLQWWGSGSPRILLDGAIVIEGKRTNLINFSEDLTALNAGPGTITSRNFIAPDGEYDAIIYEQPNNSYGPYGTLSKPNDARIMSLFLIASSSTEIGKDFRYRYSTSTVPTGSYWGKITASLPLKWTRHFSNPFQTGSGTGIENIDFSPDGRTSMPETGDPILPEHGYGLWGIQLETGSFASSYIRTSGAAAIRQIDNCSFGGIPYYMLSASQKGFIIEVTPEFSSDQFLSENMSFYVLGAYENGGLRFTAGTTNVHLRENGGIVRATLPSLSWSVGTKIRFTVDWQNMLFYQSGATNGESSSPIASWSDWDNSKNLWIGSLNGGTSVFFGKISRPWKSGSTEIL